MKHKFARRFLVPCLVLGGLAVLAPSAGAVLGRTAAGNPVSVALIKGVSAASVPGSLAAQGAAQPFSSNGNLDYNGGPVLHSMTPYLIYWDPSGTLTSTTKSVITRYFTDVAHDSGGSGNVYGVDRQYTDSIRIRELPADVLERVSGDRGYAGLSVDPSVHDEAGRGLDLPHGCPAPRLKSIV